MKTGPKQKSVYFYVLIRSWKAYKYFDKCVDSVLGQTYKNYQILFVDDGSQYTTKQKNYIEIKLKGHTVLFNKYRKYSLRNAYEVLHKYALDNQAVVVNLDVDDWLIDNEVLGYLAGVYSKNPGLLLTYGECVYWDGNDISLPSRFLTPFTNKVYPKGVVSLNQYRLYPFLPLHPRTWKVALFKRIKQQDFLRPDNGWLQFAEDQAIFYPMFEMAAGNFKALKRPLYVYNVATKDSDVKKNIIGLLRDELIIRKKHRYEPLT